MTGLLGHVPRALRSRRALVLVMFGGVFVLAGYAQVTLEPDVTRNPIYSRNYAAHLELFDLRTWGWLFIGCGLVALVAALARRHVVGFTALMGIASLWASEFLATWLSTGYDRAVLGALTWGLLVGLLAVVVGWEDPAAAKEVRTLIAEIDERP